MPEICVITLFPEMLNAVTGFGVTRRAVEEGILRITTVNPRDFTGDIHRTVDDRPFGGGPGMVMMVGPLQKAIRSAREKLERARVLYMTPQGRPLDQKGVEELGQRQEIILLAGRYEGIDERLIEQEVDEAENWPR